METESEMNLIFKQMYVFYLELNPHAESEDNPQVVLDKIREEVLALLEKLEKKEGLKVSEYPVIAKN